MSLRAAIATREITPKDSQFLVGYPHVQRMATGTADPLQATALCLVCAGAPVLMISADLLYFSLRHAQRLRARMSKALRIPMEHILLAATHTHSAPITHKLLAWQSDPVVPEPSAAYLGMIDEQILACAAEALCTLEPAEGCWSTAAATGLGGNRLDPSGPIDPDLSILTLRRAGAASPFGLFVNHAMHPTVLHEDFTQYSGDYIGAARQHLKHHLGTDLQIAWFNGACGNLSPRYFVRAQTLDESHRLGESVAERILAASEATRSDSPADAVVRAIEQEVALTPRNLPSLDEAQSNLARRRAEWEQLVRAKASQQQLRTAECAIFGAEELVFLADAATTRQLDLLLNDYATAPVQAFRINEQAVVALPGECFVEYSLQIKNSSPVPTSIVGYANGDTQGYLVTEEAALRGGYEADNSLFDWSTGQRLAETAIRLRRKLFP